VRRIGWFGARSFGSAVMYTCAAAAGAQPVTFIPRFRIPATTFLAFAHLSIANAFQLIPRGVKGNPR